LHPAAVAASESAWSLAAFCRAAALPSPTATPFPYATLFRSAFKAGTYTLSESAAPTGYTNGTTWSCTGTGTFTPPNSIALTAGQSADYSINNTDDSTSLTLDQLTTYTHGGTAPESAWTLTAD